MTPLRNSAHFYPVVWKRVSIAHEEFSLSLYRFHTPSVIFVSAQSL